MSDQPPLRPAPRSPDGGVVMRARPGEQLPAYRPVRSPLMSMGPSLEDERRRHRTARLVAVASVVAVATAVLLVWLVGMLGREVVSGGMTRGGPGVAHANATPVEQAGAPTPQRLARTVVEQGSAALPLQLPIRRQAITGIGFGPRHERGVMELEPAGTRANTSWLRRATQRFLSTTPASDLVWYQLSEGTPSMVTVGALPGTEVYAPIDGKVHTISDYEVDGEVRGSIVQLQPTGDGSTVVVVRNLDPASDLAVGQTVGQGATRLGTVRDMEGSLRSRLADYTHDSGSGVDIYVLRLDVPPSSLG